MMTDGGEISLTPPQVQAQVQLESLNAARTGLNNALINAGMATPTTVVGAKPFTQPMTIAGQTDGVANVTDDEWVTNWRSGLKAKKGTPLGNLFEKQNAERDVRNAAYADKPTEDPGEGYYWQWQERNQKWAKIRATGFGSTSTGGGKTVVSTTTDANGNTIITYSDGTTQIIPGGGGNNTNKTTSTTTNAPVTPSLAVDVFKNTLALFFGQEEMAKPWANELYAAVSKFYKTGATVDESFNLALQDARKNPALVDFTKRFKGIFDLQDKRAAGQPVTVPTIAEYFATQSKMADLLKTTGLNDLANETFLGDVIGKGVSATEFGNRITNIFDRIDLAPQEMKDTLARYFPTLDRTQLAKALALGEKGSMQLQKELAGYEVLAAAEEQGLGALGVGAIAGGLTEERAASLAAAGETYQSALGKFKTVSQLREPAAKLAGIYGMEPMTQADIENIVFKQSARESEALQNLASLELSAFSGQAGTIGSRSFASQARGSGLI